MQLHLQLQLHYITLHYTFGNTTLHYITPQYTTTTVCDYNYNSDTLHNTTATTSATTTPHYTTLITLHYSYNDGCNYDYTTLHYTTLH